MAADQTKLITRCSKCGRPLPHADIPPAYCPKCELINALTVERYTTHERTEE